MSPAQIQEMLEAAPFIPFRIVLSDGTQTYDIQQPTRVLVSTRYVHVGIGLDPTERVAERIVRLDPLHITQLIPLTGPPPPALGNGQEAASH